MLALSLAVFTGAAATVTLPEDTNAVLHNPGMGWVVYENYPIDPAPAGSSIMLSMPGENFPGVDTVALMFTWADVETREGVYDFSRVDRAYDYWKVRGKALQLRMSAESLLYWARQIPPAGQGMPDYVRAKVPPSQTQIRIVDQVGYPVVDARNIFYRQRLAAFLRAVDRHFDRDRPVDLIDLRGFGAWGEWHDGFRYPDARSRRFALERILDIWSSNLRSHTLALSYSYDPDGPAALYAGPGVGFFPAFTTNYDEFLRFSAFDYALTKPNISFRRDGFGGAVHANERKLAEEAFTKFHRAPLVGEFVAGYDTMRRGGSNWVTGVVEDALTAHPNYLNLIGWQGADALKFLTNRPDLINLGLREMGYRLMPSRVTYPTTLTNSAAFEIAMTSANHGVGRALHDEQIRFLLLNSVGLKIAESDWKKLSASFWLKGEVHPESFRVRFKDAPPGRYELAFTVRDPVAEKFIRLPLAGQSDASQYVIGPTAVQP